jgi:polysaccharide deacetylase 2 family uncharacterized protein YibQ
MRTLRGEQVTQTDETADDAFSDDVVDTVPQAEARIDAVAHVALVVVSMGHSVAIEAPFTQLPVAMTCVIDPHAPSAHDIADMAVNAGKAVYVQLDADATARDVAAVPATFPNAGGIAVRLAPDVRSEETLKTFLRAAAAAHLAVFDEYGSQPRVMRIARQLQVAYAGRSITVDNHLGAAYVDFMLEQAVRIARSQRVAVMARPVPSTLAALQNLAYRAASAGITAEGLPSQASGKSAE